jgi:hypothetical protein
MKYCQDYPGAPPCCLSCHEDADDYPDYPLCEIIEDGVVVAEVCCVVAEYARRFVPRVCTRPAPHICAKNGPCNGWPKT